MPTALERRGDFSQSLDNNGNPFPYIRDYTTGLPCSATDTRACFADGGVLGRIPANRLYAPGLAALGIFPDPNATGLGADLNYQSQAPNNTPRREDMLRMDYQATDNWRITGRYMNTVENIVQAYGTTWAGNGSDQLPTPVLFLHPGSNYMLSATGILSPSMSLEVSWGRAANSLNYELQQESLFRASNPAFAQLPLFYPDAVQGDYVPDFQFRGGRLGNAGQYQTDRGPFTNENITHDVVANLTKVAGSHAFKSGSTTRTATSRRASSPASTARSTSRTTPATRSTRATPTRTRRPASSTPTRRPRSSPFRNGATTTSSSTRRTTGRPATS